MALFKVHEAKTQLSQLIQRACAGEEIVIARGDQPVVRLTPVEPVRSRRRFGAMRELLRFDESFFDALPDDELDAWGQ